MVLKLSGVNIPSAGARMLPLGVVLLVPPRTCSVCVDLVRSTSAAAEAQVVYGGLQPW